MSAEQNKTMTLGTWALELRASMQAERERTMLVVVEAGDGGAPIAKGVAYEH
jgi:hypothetical protein